MAVIRELVTSLTYKVDEAGLKQYEAGFARVKEAALGIAGAMGLAFSATKIYEFIDSLLDMGKEINKVKSQITNLLRPVDDINTIMDGTFKIAQNTRFAYTQVLDTFKELLNVSQDTKVSQEDLLATTENVFKAFRIDKTSKEDIEAVWSTLNRIFAVGAARPMTIGRLERLSPSVYKMIQDYASGQGMGTDLRELAKEHKITTEFMVRALANAGPQWEDKFRKVPINLAQGFIYARNAFGPLMADFIKATKLSILLGTAVVRMTDAVVNGIKYFNREIVNIKQLIEVLGYALAVAVGPWLIKQLVLAAYWTARWAVFTALANVQWILLAAAIFGVGLAIQDIVYWMQGKGSLIGSWVGPFEDLAENFKKLNLFAGPRIIQDLISGDFKKAWDDLKLVFTETDAAMVAIIATAASVKVGIMAWNLIKLTGLFDLLGLTKKKIAEVGAEAAAAEAAMSGGKGKGGGSVPPVVTGGGAGKAATTLGRLKNLGFWGLMLALAAGFTYEQIRSSDTQGPEADYPEGPKGTELYGPPELSDTDKKRQAVGNFFSGLVSPFKYLLPGLGKVGQSLSGDVTPGAIGGVTDNRNQSVTVTMNPTTNITVQPSGDQEIANTVREQVDAANRRAADEIRNQIVTAVPRTEAATQ